MGAAILMGMQYGAKDYDTLHRQISTTMLSGVVFSVTLTVLCVIFAVPMLKLIQVDPSIMDLTAEYLRIIFWGLMFTFLYNFFSSTLMDWLTADWEINSCLEASEKLRVLAT